MAQTVEAQLTQELSYCVAISGKGVISWKIILQNLHRLITVPQAWLLKPDPL